MKKIISILIAVVAIIGTFSTIDNATVAMTANEEVKNKYVQIGGQPFGIKFYSDGVMITKIRENSPADVSGLKVNDIIIRINDENIKSNNSVRNLIENSNGKEISFTVNRDYEIIKFKVTPEYKNGKFTAGMWIKDSCAGIGTITYYDEENKTFACLGHGICEKESSKLLPMYEGDICPVVIENIDKAKKGYPGGLNGYFEDKEIGTAYNNSHFGLFCNLKIKTNYKSIKVAEKKEIKKGEAYIYTTISGNTPSLYKINIKPKSRFNFDKTKDMIVEITDERLLKETGGIVQGMSGSPIIQNNMLVGAVTHVFVNEPSKGYGIFAQTMLEQAQ